MARDDYFVIVYKTIKSERKFKRNKRYNTTDYKEIKI